MRLNYLSRKRLGLQLGFNGYTTRFQAVGYPALGESLEFLDLSKVLEEVSKDLFHFKPE